MALLFPLRNTSYSSILRVNFSKTATQRGLPYAHGVHLFSEVRREAMFDGTITLSDSRSSRKTSLRRRLHIHDLKCSDESGRRGRA